MLYLYEATNKHGQPVSGEFEAADPTVVVEFLQKQNLIPVRVEPKNGADQKFKGLNRGVFEKVTTLDQIIMVRNLSASLRAGLNLIEALEIMIEDANKAVLARILTDAKNSIENGQSFGTAFEANQRYFPPFFVGMIRAGEASGKLDATLGELGKFLTRQYELKKKVRSALAYPMILLTAATGIIVLLVGFILPKLQKVFLQSSFKLPLATRILLKISHIISFSWTLDVVIVIGIFLLFRFLLHTVPGKAAFAKLTFKIPGIRDLLKKIALVRFARTMSSLISSGVPILDALDLAAISVGNENYRAVLAQVKEDVTGGEPLSKALGKYPKMFPRLLNSLAAVGERTGNLETVLSSFADFFEEEVDDTLKTLTTFLEPLLLLIMGAIVCGIALSILLPIYQFVGKFA